MTAPRTVTVTTYSGSGPTQDGAMTLLEVIGWFQERLAEIPEAYRETATCRIDSETSYDVSYPVVEISYERPETDTEMQARLVVAERKRRENEARELAQLEALQRKYGTGGTA